jgi:hypothetical protein
MPEWRWTDPSLARVQSNYSIRFCTPQLYHSVTRLISLIQYEELSIERAIINTGFIRIVLLPLPACDDHVADDAVFQVKRLYYTRIE